MTQYDQRYQQVEQQYNAGRDITIVAPLSLTEAQQRRNRARMLAKVRSLIGELEQPKPRGLSFDSELLVLETRHVRLAAVGCDLDVEAARPFRTHEELVAVAESGDTDGG